MTDTTTNNNLIIHFLWVIVVLYLISIMEKNYQKYLFNKTINNSMNKIMEIYTTACDIAVKIHASTMLNNRQNLPRQNNTNINELNNDNVPIANAT